MLDMTKLDAGNLKPDYQEFSIDQALLPLVERYQAMAKEKQLRFHYHKSSALVKTDRKLLNLLHQEGQFGFFMTKMQFRVRTYHFR